MDHQREHALAGHIRRRTASSRSPQWIFRSQAAVTFLRAVDFADDGYIANGELDV